MTRTGKTSPRQSLSKILTDFVSRRGKRHKSRIEACQKAGMDLSHEIAIAAGWKRRASTVEKVVSDWGQVDADREYPVLALSKGAVN